MIVVTSPSHEMLSRLSLAWLLGGHAPGGPAVTHRFTMLLASGRSETVDRPHAGVCIRCRSGRLWITHDGDPKDVVLEAGQAYSAQSPHSMTVHAVGDSEVDVTVSSGPAAA